MLPRPGPPPSPPLLIAAQPAAACTFCDGGLRGRQTLRLHHAGAKVVLAGQLKNPRFDQRGPGGGTTELHVTAVLKDDPARGGRAVLTLPQYLPGDRQHAARLPRLLRRRRTATSTRPTACPRPPAVVEYLEGRREARRRRPGEASSASSSSTSTRPTPAVAADAFFEFARAADADILKAAKHFDRGQAPQADRRREHAGRAARRVRVPARRVRHRRRRRVPRRAC